MTLIDSPAFYLLAIPAILLNGVSKGGFAGAFSGLSVPLLALAISPVQAAGIMLPILIMMDLFGLTQFWRRADRRVLATMLAGVHPSIDLLTRLLQLNTEVLLGSFLLFEDGTLVFSYTMMGEAIEFAAFEFALRYVAQVGDDYDEELQSIAGGMRAEDILLGG